MTEAREMGLHPRLARNKAELVELLQHKYPMHQFAKMFIMKGKFGQQRRLEQAVSSLFPVGLLHLMRPLSHSFIKEQEILVNARKEPGIVNPATGDYLELDIWLPTLNLAFEFQVRILIYFWILFSNQSPKERHHYLKVTSYSDVSLEEIKDRDKLKQTLVAQKGITLITVPCWWDRQRER